MCADPAIKRWFIWLFFFLQAQLVAAGGEKKDCCDENIFNEKVAAIVTALLAAHSQTNSDNLKTATDGLAARLDQIQSGLGALNDWKEGVDKRGGRQKRREHF